MKKFYVIQDAISRCFVQNLGFVSDAATIYKSNESALNAFCYMLEYPQEFDELREMHALGQSSIVEVDKEEADSLKSNIDYFYGDD